MSDETIGELHDRLPVDEWVYLPEFGVRVKRFADPQPVQASEPTKPTSAQLRETQAALAASQADLTAMERERDDLARQLKSSRKSYAWLDRVAANFRESGDLARGVLARVDEAAGRDIAKPDEPLVERVGDLLLGRTEATQRALELAAELASARAELEQLRSRNAELERLRGES